MNVFEFLQVPAGVKIEKLTESYGKFSFEPLNEGYAITLGNALRRVLLSSIPGVAVVGVEIENVDHEFSTVPGVQEDVLNIILNLKGVLFKFAGEKPEGDIAVTLDKTGPCEVRAGDLEVPFGVEVLNPEHYIATLMDGAVLSARIYLSTGIGYKQADIELVNRNIGYIPVDASYSPVKRVAFHTEKSILRNFYDFERLVLEVETNGTVDPITCVNKASEILVKYLSFFGGSFQKRDEEAEGSVDEEETVDENLLKTIDELELNVRASNCLKSHSIKYIYQLVQKTDAELLSTKNFGKQSLKEIKNALKQLNLELDTHFTREQLEKIESLRKKLEENSEKE